ncbi:MAG TPA: phosphoglycerate mutase family protein [Acidimicrobiales bacterium]|nr:phosphoglycerate mutase family protein [Acidimicrobiales bacterium]
MHSTPPSSGRIILVRHADAGDRTVFERPDYLRPLTEKGIHQAREIAEILGTYDPSRIVSSKAVRCLATVAPLAERLALEIEQVDELFEGSDPRESWSELLDLVAERDGTLVACSHGDVIPGIIELLSDCSAPHSKFPKIKKGSMVVLDLGGAPDPEMHFVPAPRRGGQI